MKREDQERPPILEEALNHRGDRMTRHVAVSQLRHQPLLSQHRGLDAGGEEGVRAGPRGLRSPPLIGRAASRCPTRPHPSTQPGPEEQEAALGVTRSPGEAATGAAVMLVCARRSCFPSGIRC